MTSTTNSKIMTTKEVADRFQELAQQEKWFEIQNELFADHVKSIEPENSPYLKNAEGKSQVHKKAMDFVSKISQVHEAYTSNPIISAHHFAVSRVIDITTSDFGRIKMEEIMLYEVRAGKIVLEQFFY